MIINDDGTVSMLGTAERFIAPGFEPMIETDIPEDTTAEQDAAEALYTPEDGGAAPEDMEALAPVYEAPTLSRVPTLGIADMYHLEV